MLNEIKEKIRSEKTIFIGIVLLLVGGIVAWNVWSNGNVSDNRGTANEVKSNIQSTGNELNRAGQAIATSQSITGEIRRTNQNIQQSNQSARQSVEVSQSINKSSHDLIREGQQIVSNLPRSDKE